MAVEEKPALFKLDDYIECRLPQWSDYFKGYVTKVEKGNVYTVLFDDGERVKRIPENLMRKVIIVEFSVNEIIEAKCEGWIKYYKGEIIKKKDNMHYDIKFMDGEVKKNIPSVRMRKLEEISKPPPRPATGTGTRVMTSHSASRPMSAAAAGSYKAPKRKAMTFAAWKRGGASSIYGHGSGMKYRPSTVPLNGFEMRRVYKPTHSGRTGKTQPKNRDPLAQ